MADAKGAQKQFNRALKDRHFEPAYYLHGDDDFLKEAAVRDLVRAATDPSTRDFNLEVLRAGEIDAATLAALLGTPPMMADRRMVVIRDVPSLKKDVRRALDRYLASPSPDVVVALVSPAGTKADKSLENSAMAIPYEPLSGHRVPKWILHHAQAELKIEVDPMAAVRLQAAVGDDLQLLSAELEKVAGYVAHRAATGGSPVADVSAVDAVAGVNRGESLGDLLDRIAERDAPGAMALVEHVLALPKSNGVTVVMAIGAQTLAMAWARAAIAEGMAPSRLRDALFGLFKEKSVFLGRPWGDAVAAVAGAVNNGRWTDLAIDEALEALLVADTLLKESGVSSDDQLVISLILTLCAPASPQRLA